MAKKLIDARMTLTARFGWIHFVSRRISKIDRKSRTAATSVLASLGICLGVAALIVVMSVMNGFQMSFIDAIMEISSYHVQVWDVQADEFESWCAQNENVVCAVPFCEAQGLAVGSSGRQSAALIRFVPPDVRDLDEGFAQKLKVTSGEFDLGEPDSIVLGSTLARSLGVRVGSTVNIAALSGSSDTQLLSSNRKFTVKGIFFTGYAQINAVYAFVSLDGAKTYLGSGAKGKCGVKIKNSSKDAAFLKSFGAHFPEAQAVGWRQYNRSFFGVLRTEKNILFFVVLLIFVVVAVNIFNSMRRLVFERKEEIAVLSALGAFAKEVQAVFVLQGATVGLWGALAGLVLGVALSKNMKAVFTFLGRAQFALEYAMASLFKSGSEHLVTENPMFAVYARIPSRLFASETVLIFLFGVLSSLVSSWLASRWVLKINVAEVLHND